MQTAGFGPVTYRLRTELGIEAWHWNPIGTWSDPLHRQGYWTSSDRSATPILVCNGYKLPRRGDTFDQAENNGYSRIDDGSPATFWKSDPYLSQHFTGEPDAQHAQWVVVDLGSPRLINAVRILWGTPYATIYRVEYWAGDDPIYFNEQSRGAWRPFPGGTVSNGRGGAASLRLATRHVEYLRILMSKSSNTAPPGSTDIRDGLGYAVRELYAGRIDRSGHFHDLIRHGKRNDRQTVIYTSSTDPWHRASDRDPMVEQPGLDLVMRSGLTHGLPVMVPVPLLYDTPENAAAEIRYLEWRGYPIGRVEMGEEPDGQYVLPEDYATLYVQWARVIHTIDPSLALGGPGFQTSLGGWGCWPDRHGNVSWMNRFLGYLRAHGSLCDFRFFSFEWYPFTWVNRPPQPQLLAARGMLATSLRLLHTDGVPGDIPWIITEYGYSPFAGQNEVELPGAILNAEIVAQFLEEGGSAAYLYGWQPATPMTEPESQGSYGNLMLFLANDNNKIIANMPTYWGARLLTQEWAQSGGGMHLLYPAASNVLGQAGRPLVTAYAVYRPDHQWAVLLLNKDAKRAHSVVVRFHGSIPDGGSLRGPVSVIQYSPVQYRWRANGEHGRPTRDLPPAHSVVQATDRTRFFLPSFSITVIKGTGPLPRGR